MENVYYCCHCKKIYSRVPGDYYRTEFICFCCKKSICFGCVYSSKFEVNTPIDEKQRYIQKSDKCEWKEENNRINPLFTREEKRDIKSIEKFAKKWWISYTNQKIIKDS
jgi:hypothetical protein